MKKKYEIDCKSCGATFDCSEQLNVWRDALFLEIDKVVKKMKGGD